MSSRLKVLAAAVAVVACAAVPSVAAADDVVVTSFDATPIVVHPYPGTTGSAAPTVLLGPGYGSPGAKVGDAFVQGLLAQGYNVVTWDPRGFGVSGGTVNIDDPLIEGRDTSAIIDWIAQQPWAQLDGPNDPRLGMAGGSYGAGIQYATAANDHRIDALTPIVGWHTLETALYKDQTFKQGWNGLLYFSGKSAAENDGLAGGAAGVQTGGLDPHIGDAYTAAVGTGKLRPEDLAWFRGRGPGEANLTKITAPTLVIGGTVDTLFPLDEDIAIYRNLVGHHVPTKMLWFCGGHGVCHTGTGDPGGPKDAALALGSGHVTAAITAWFAKYLKGDASVSTGPGFEWLADDATWRSAAAYPAPAGPPVTVTAKGKPKLKIVTGPGSGAATEAKPEVAAKALQVPFKLARATQLLGPPTLRITYQGKASTKSVRVFAQIVDVKRKLVVGNQVTPIPMVLDAKKRSVTRPLTPIAAAGLKGGRYVLQLVSASQVWLPQRAKGSFTASKLTLTLPTVR